MIKRDVGNAQWRRRQYGPNVAALELDIDQGKLTIINVYNPRTSSPRLQEWPSIATALEEARGEILVIGDFNSHHPAWGGRGAACEQGAQHLLVETGRRDLALLTPEGEVTWRRGPQSSVIDLTFASQALRERVAYCGPEERWALPQDHIPVRISLDLHQANDKQEKRRRYATEKLDREGLATALQKTGWHQSDNPLESLHQALEALLPQYCPKAKPCLRARPDWSPKAAELLAGARRARRRHTATHQQEELNEYKHLSNQLKREIRRTARANWRRLVESLTGDQRLPYNRGLWRLSRWSRRVAGKQHTDPHIPALRRNEGEEPTRNDAERARILGEKFFPQAPQASRTQPAGGAQSQRNIPINQEVTTEELTAILGALPTGKAPGPDGIPNEILKALSPEIAEGLAQGISKTLAGGTLPNRLKESTTIALRKEGKRDYSLPSSYRPIALENTLAKVVEKVLANRLSLAAEEHALLPWNQMGARKDRSTTSAIGLLTSCVQTAWQAKPGSVVSVLSLDLAGAFDNVPHSRLLEILRTKGLPEWIVRMIDSFTQARRTRIAYTGYKSDWITTSTGIPQGSPLSPILFLYYISSLLETFQDPEAEVMGFGFVDDTNLVTWGPSAAENCRKLTAAHTQCEEWASTNGARFAPEKYQLMHFTRRRRHACEDLASTVRIGNHEAQVQERAIKILGVWLDPALTWKEHIAQAARKGLAASEALSRIATSTWGPSARHARMLYTAVVRPTMLYASQEWSIRADGKPIAEAATAPLRKVQNECLRKVTGAYRRTPRAALEREASVMPIDIYMQTTRYQQASRTKDHQVEAQITRAADAIWQRMRRARRAHHRPQTGHETSVTQAAEKAQEIKDWLEEGRLRRDRAHGPQALRRRAARPPKPSGDPTLLKRWGNLAWQRRWEGIARKLPNRHRAATWNTPWAQDVRKLYAGLTKAEATALILMRTEVIGLNAWLAAAQVPNTPPTCPCGWYAQTVRHVLLYCSRHDRTELLTQCGTERFEEILMRPDCAKHAARWLVRSGAMEQFRLAAEITGEDIEGYKAFPDAREW